MAKRRKKTEEPVRFDKQEREWGAECVTKAEDGREIRCPAFPEECSYVRVLDENGAEVGYWNFEEWQEDPQEVMGAILGCLHGQREDEADLMEVTVGDRRIEISGQARLTCTLIHYDHEGFVESVLLHDEDEVWYLDAKGTERGKMPSGVYWANPNDQVFCKFCKGPESLKQAHLHDGMYVCEQCWDDRLHATE
jgi:hypothetical protein